MGREVLFEFYRLGNTTKVTAVDPETMVEVSIVGPSSSGETALRQAALRKLEYVLARRSRGR